MEIAPAVLVGVHAVLLVVIIALSVLCGVLIGALVWRPRPGAYNSVSSIRLRTFVDAEPQGVSMPTQARIDQLVVVSAAFMDAFGNPGVFPPGVLPQWTVSDSNLADLEVADDGRSTKVVPTGTAGTVTVICTLGALVSSTEIEFTGGQVVAINLTVTVTDPE